MLQCGNDDWMVYMSKGMFFIGIMLQWDCVTLGTLSDTGGSEGQVCVACFNA